MPITYAQKQEAQDCQLAAARDPAKHVRLVAGPGTGKSRTIRERVSWLLYDNVPARGIHIVSFTRASARDLKRRIVPFCQTKGYSNADRLHVTTLHSLALRLLRTAGELHYPVDPIVMDKWELENIMDREFSYASKHQLNGSAGYTPTRCGEIRKDYEAFCGTGGWDQPGAIPPKVPISKQERADYDAFHTRRTQTYSCVLPGEIVRKCVKAIDKGFLDPTDILGIEHLIVDEYQDLCPSDIQFIDRIAESGANVFVAGDDDQSIYSFRYATPEGLQSFPIRHPKTSDHKLRSCFRCTVSVLSAATELVQAYAAPERIDKALLSLYTDSKPPVFGSVHRWRFKSATQEVRSIAESCARLIAGGVPHQEIMILVSSRTQLPQLCAALSDTGVDYTVPARDELLETKPGRFAFALLRIACRSDDYVAHRLILGLHGGAAEGTCNKIADAVVSHNLNYKNLFYQTLAPGLFEGRQLSALQHAQKVCKQLEGWCKDCTMGERGPRLFDILQDVFGESMAAPWADFAQHLPEGMILEEVRDLLMADTEENRASLMAAVYERLGITAAKDSLIPKIRMLTMHGAKGLDASVVFVPRLIEGVIPNTKEISYPGLIQEAARRLYVSITRARVACILSYPKSGVVHGKWKKMSRSRYTENLGGSFVQRDCGLSSDEVDAIVSARGYLELT